MIQCKVNVQKIPKERLFKGEKGIYLDFQVSERQTPDQYGNTHSVLIYDKTTKEKIYIGEGKQVEFNAQPGPQNQVTDHDDLPF